MTVTVQIRARRQAGQVLHAAPAGRAADPTTGLRPHLEPPIREVDGEQVSPSVTVQVGSIDDRRVPCEPLLQDGRSARPASTVTGVQRQCAFVTHREQVHTAVPSPIASSDKFHDALPTTAAFADTGRPPEPSPA